MIVLTLTSGNTLRTDHLTVVTLNGVVYLQTDGGQVRRADVQSIELA